MIQELANSYEGASYEALVERWGRASKEHMTVLIDCCGVLATGLEITRRNLMEHGYVQTEKKIDPVHGPDAKQRLPEPDRSMDADDPTRRHKCGPFSTAFNPGEDEAFTHAERYARRNINLSDPPPWKVEFSPEQAWGPGDHSGRFRGYYVDPTRPVTHGNVNDKSADFHGANLVAFYRQDEATGGPRLVTMYPEPDKARNT